MCLSPGRGAGRGYRVEKGIRKAALPCSTFWALREVWLMELLIPGVCQPVASPASQLSLPRAGVVDDSELVCKAGVAEEWGREFSLYLCVWNSSIQPRSPGCFPLSVSENSASHRYGVKEGFGLVCKPPSFVRSPSFLTLQSTQVWKSESFFVTFKSPLCNKSGG